MQAPKSYCTPTVTNPFNPVGSKRFPETPDPEKENVPPPGTAETRASILSDGLFSHICIIPGTVITG